MSNEIQFMYQSPDGGTHIVDSLSEVPQKYKNTAKKISLGEGDAEGSAEAVGSALVGDGGGQSKILKLIKRPLKALDNANKRVAATIANPSAANAGIGKAHIVGVGATGIAVIVVGILYRPVRGLMLKVGIALIGLSVMFAVVKNFNAAPGGGTKKGAVSQTRERVKDAEDRMKKQQELLERLAEQP
jgi:hypothetical protein